MIGNIYKITNLINKKQYVGKTLKKIQERFEEHKKDSKKRKNEIRPLYLAFKKYGIENFTISLIEQVEISFLDEREKYWIEKLDTFKNGYNATIGGDGTILYDYEKIGFLIKKGLTKKEIVSIIGCCADTVKNVAQLLKIEIKKDTSNYKAVSQFNINNTWIQDFISLKEAADWLIINNKAKNPQTKDAHSGIKSHISSTCRGKRKTAYGYKWQFKI